MNRDLGTGHWTSNPFTIVFFYIRRYESDQVIGILSNNCSKLRMQMKLLYVGESGYLEEPWK